jgi:hypothetical protein
MSVIAAEIVSHDKERLVEMVTVGPFLMMLSDARESARGIADLIGAAECRLAAALAVIEPDEDEV